MTYRVLIAEDSATMQRVLEIAFAGEAAELHVTASVEEAAEAALRLRPDVVLADGALEGGGGYTLCAQLLGDARMSKLPVLLLTSAQHPFDAAQAQAAGVWGHVEKPFATHHLVAQVKRALQQNRVDAAAELPPPSTFGPPPPAYRAAAAQEATPPSSPTAMQSGLPPYPLAPAQAPEAPFAHAPAPAAAHPGQAAMPPAPPVGYSQHDATGGLFLPQQQAHAVAATALASRPPPNPTLVAPSLTARPVPAPKFALPPLPNWDQPPQHSDRAPTRVGDAVAEVLAQLAPTLDAERLEAKVLEVVEREVVAILWEVIPKLAEKHLLAAQSRGAQHESDRHGSASHS